MQHFQSFLELTILSFNNVQITIGTLVAVFFIILGFYFGLKGIKLFINKALGKETDAKAARVSRLYQLIKYTAYVIGVAVSIETLGFDLTIILGASAALLVGIGLGLQEVFKDVFSGIVLLIEGVFQVGDVIEIEGMVGLVRQIDLRTSKIETRDGIYVILPNSKLVTEKLINWSLNKKETRFSITVGVAYGSDTQLVSKILKSCAEKHANVSRHEPIWVKFEDFGDSALIFKLYFWTNKQWEIERTRSELRFNIDTSFRDANITIPFPQRDLHLKNSVRISE